MLDITPVTSTGQIVKSIEEIAPTIANHQILLRRANIPPMIAIAPVTKSAPFGFAEDSMNGIPDLPPEVAPPTELESRAS